MNRRHSLFLDLLYVGAGVLQCVCWLLEMASFLFTELRKTAFPYTLFLEKLKSTISKSNVNNEATETHETVLNTVGRSSAQASKFQFVFVRLVFSCAGLFKCQIGVLQN